MPKLTTEQAVKLLQTLGVKGVELVESDTDSDFIEAELIDMVDANRGTIIKPRLMEELESSSRATAVGEARQKIIKSVRDLTGVERKQLEEMDNINDIIKFAVEHTKGLSKGDAEGVRKEIDDILERHNEEKEALVKEWEGKYNDLNGKYIDRDITSYLQSALKDAPLMQNADKNILASDFKQHLANKFHLSYNEVDKALGFFKKDNPAMPALDGNKHVDIMKEAQDFFTPRGQWVTDMRNTKPEIPNGQPYQAPTAPNPIGKPGSTNLTALNDAVNNYINQAMPAKV